MRILDLNFGSPQPHSASAPGTVQLEVTTNGGRVEVRMNFSVFVEIVLAAIAVRVAFHFIDKNRIQEEVEAHGL